MDIQQVTTWVYETTEYHSAPVPLMPKHERDAWVALSNKLSHLTQDERALWRALNRKLQYRARFDISDQPASGGEGSEE